MKSKLISGLYCSKPNVEWKKVRLGVKVDEFIKDLQSRKEYVTSQGFLNIDICVSKDGQKLYATLDTYEFEREKQVTSNDHSPDRDQDLPF